MAKLVIDGKEHGIHGFVVQLRSLKDHSTVPGELYEHTFLLFKIDPINQVHKIRPRSGGYRKKIWIRRNRQRLFKIQQTTNTANAHAHAVCARYCRWQIWAGGQRASHVRGHVADARHVASAGRLLFVRVHHNRHQIQLREKANTKHWRVHLH